MTPFVKYTKSVLTTYQHRTNTVPTPTIVGDDTVMVGGRYAEGVVKSFLMMFSIGSKKKSIFAEWSIPHALADNAICQ